MDAGTGRQLGMPVKDFVDEVFVQLNAGSDHVIVGSIGPEDNFNEMLKKRLVAFEWLAKALRARH
jgi:hypothetical protein